MRPFIGGGTGSGALRQRGRAGAAAAAAATATAPPQAAAAHRPATRPPRRPRINAQSTLMMGHTAPHPSPVCTHSSRVRPVMAAAAVTEPAPAASTSTTSSSSGGGAQLPPPPLSFAGRPELYDGRGRLMLKSLTLSELEEWCGSIGERVVGCRVENCACAENCAWEAEAETCSGRLLLPPPLTQQPPKHHQPTGETPRRAKQLWRWLYSDDGLAGAPEDTVGLQNGFSAVFCEKIRDAATFDGGLRLESVAAAKDGTKKLVFKLTEGEGRGGSVEAVLIPVVREGGSKPRVTLCVSSQVGCWAV
jgi:23S rRNA (adenine2503-C2)-methyltransferase